MTKTIKNPIIGLDYRSKTYETTLVHPYSWRRFSNHMIFIEFSITKIFNFFYNSYIIVCVCARMFIGKFATHWKEKNTWKFVQIIF
jgi:hypothetical protein